MASGSWVCVYLRKLHGHIRDTCGIEADRADDLVALNSDQLVSRRTSHSDSSECVRVREACVLSQVQGNHRLGRLPATVLCVMVPRSRLELLMAFTPCTANPWEHTAQLTDFDVVASWFQLCDPQTVKQHDHKQQGGEVNVFGGRGRRERATLRSNDSE